jgi:DNA-binding NarL/FixJ family response regulator
MIIVPVTMSSTRVALAEDDVSRQLWVTEGTVEKHVRSILMKLRLPGADDTHRRVLAVLAFLDTR